MTPIDGRNDFDFLFGQWAVHHRKTADTLDRTCTEWIEFDGTCDARQVLGGLGNIDTVSGVMPDGRPLEGMTLRLYDPAADLWRLYWASAARPGPLAPPVEGRFRDGVGIFQCRETIGGRPVLVRYLWSRITATSARWEQDFSFDDGASRDPANWIMTFTRQR